MNREASPALPGVCCPARGFAIGSLFATSFGKQLVIAWVVAAATTVLGLVLSAVADMPTGPSLVSCFGAILALFVVARTFLPQRSLE
ncbi:MAG: metal ABC transporter permease [Phycisphaerales bacterium]|nr:MAG: metal ABC transporter permease [Phycisphaerales bacterium]